jgi:hypothetical protein
LKVFEARPISALVPPLFGLQIKLLRKLLAMNVMPLLQTNDLVCW